ncbi:DUF2971 domain-containing protein [Tenacibaculum holothuriorum]|nr:DUF2971 domain-containing protein [Tenacibaculum holothuriorum]
MIPEEIYHYTSINSLAYILNYKTLRFTILSNLNDPLEGKTEDVEYCEKLVYSSSWSISEKDTIPMWKLYTDLKGVRLKINPKNLFADSTEIREENYGLHNKYFVSTLNRPLSLKVKSIDGLNVRYEASDKIFGPDKVKYIEEGEEYPSVITRLEEGMQGGKLELHRVGLAKNKNWKFENEIRFRIPFQTDIITMNGMTPKEFVSIYEFESSFYDVDINPKVFETAEIMLAPLCEKSDEIIVNSLIQEFAPNIKITRSNINIK